MRPAYDLALKDGKSALRHKKIAADRYLSANCRKIILPDRDYRKLHED